MAAASTRTPDGDALFFAALSIGNTVAQACLAAGYARSCVYEWRAKDEGFAKAWTSAVYLALTAEADRRLIARYEHPIYRNGIVAGYVHTCPDGLLFERYLALRANQDIRHDVPLPAASRPAAPKPWYARWRERLASFWLPRSKAPADAR